MENSTFLGRISCPLMGMIQFSEYLSYLLTYILLYSIIEMNTLFGRRFPLPLVVCSLILYYTIPIENYSYLGRHPSYPMLVGVAAV